MSEPSCCCAHESDEATTSLVSGLLDDVVDLQREVAQLRHALSGAQALEQAKGMLMLAYGYGPGRASRALAGFATDLGVSRRTVAERMVEAADTADPGRPRPRLSVVPTGLLIRAEADPPD